MTFDEWWATNRNKIRPVRMEDAARELWQAGAVAERERLRWRTPEQAVIDALEQEVDALRDLLRRLLAESLRAGDRVQDSAAVAQARQWLHDRQTQ